MIKEQGSYGVGKVRGGGEGKVRSGDGDCWGGVVERML